MIKSLIRTAVLVVLVLVLAQFVPVVAAHEWLLIAAAVIIGMIGFFLRTALFLALLAVAAGLFFFFVH